MSSLVPNQAEQRKAISRFLHLKQELQCLFHEDSARTENIMTSYPRKLIVNSVEYFRDEVFQCRRIISDLEADLKQHMFIPESPLLDLGRLPFPKLNATDDEKQRMFQDRRHIYHKIGIATTSERIAKENYDYWVDFIRKYEMFTEKKRLRRVIHDEHGILLPEW